jgi:hypothetical protein
VQKGKKDAQVSSNGGTSYSMMSHRFQGTRLLMDVKYSALVLSNQNIPRYSWAHTERLSYFA